MANQPKPAGRVHRETEHYLLRSITDNLVTETFVQWYADPEVMRYVNDPMDVSLEQLKSGFQNFDNRNNFALLITDKENGAEVGIFRIYFDHFHGQVNTSVMIGNKDYWGRNVVLEVRDYIIRLLFKNERNVKIVGTVRGRNFPAQFNYTKQGFKKEGVRRKHYRNRDGVLEDVVEFGLLREDWLASQQGMKET